MKDSAGDASNRVFAFVTFRTCEIEDINLLGMAQPPEAAAAPSSFSELLPSVQNVPFSSPSLQNFQELNSHILELQEQGQTVAGTDAVDILDIAAVRDLTRPLSPFRHPDAMAMRNRDLAER